MPEIIPTPVVPVVETKTFSAENPPKTKEEWNQLRESDVNTWATLTQSNTDRLVRENRELQEKYNLEQQEKHNLAAEVNRYKPVVAPIQQPSVQDKPYGIDNFPKNQSEWDALAIESPTFHADLRVAYNAVENNRRTADYNAKSAQIVDARKIQEEHPDMYIPELDGQGQPKKDNNGKIVLKRDQNGGAILNIESEKGKLLSEIYRESTRPDGTNPLDNLPNAMTLMSAEVERRLIRKGQAVINQNQEIRQNQVAVPGVTPPVSQKVSFKSNEEKLHAEKAVERGVYKDVEQYCQIRDTGIAPIYDENRRPDFTRK